MGQNDTKLVKLVQIGAIGSNRSKLDQTFPKGTKWVQMGQLSSIGPNWFKWVNRGPNWSKQVNTGPIRFKLVQIHQNGSKYVQKSKYYFYGLIRFKIVQILTKKSSKWVRHNHVSWSSFFHYWPIIHGLVNYFIPYIQEISITKSPELQKEQNWV